MEPNRGLFTFLLLIVSAVTAITANYSGASKLAACIAIGGGTTIAAYAFYSAYRLRQVLDERQRNESIDLALSLAAGLLGCFMAGGVAVRVLGLDVKPAFFLLAAVPALTPVLRSIRNARSSRSARDSQIY